MPEPTETGPPGKDPGVGDTGGEGGGGGGGRTVLPKSTSTELAAGPKPSKSKYSLACVPTGNPLKSKVTVRGEPSAAIWPEVATPETVTCGPKNTAPVCWMFSSESVLPRPDTVPRRGVLLLASSSATSNASGGNSPLAPSRLLLIVKLNDCMSADMSNAFEKPVSNRGSSWITNWLPTTWPEPWIVHANPP